MKCINCKEEWEINNSKNLKEKYCPYCGIEIIQIDKDSVVDVPSFLRYIIYVDGDKSLKNSQKIVSLFSDFLPNLIVEKRILRIVLESEVYEKIYNNRESVSEQELSKYINYLEDDFGLSNKWVMTAIRWILTALDLTNNIDSNSKIVGEKCADNIGVNTKDEEIIQLIKTKHVSVSKEYFNMDLFSFADVLFMPKDKTWVLLKDGTLIVGTEKPSDEFCFRGTNASRIRSIVISKNVTKTQTRAFYGLKNLVEVILPPTLIEIGFQCFSECSELKTVFIQSELKTIKGKAFEDCFSLENINLPDSVKYIGDDAFYNCKIHNIRVSKECAVCNGNYGISQ